MKKGKLLHNSLIRSVLRVPFERRESDHLGRDGAFSGLGTGITLNTTVYGGEGAEKLAFYRAFNGALAAGMEPSGAELGLLFPEGETEQGIKARMERFNEAAKAEGVKLLGGHTAVSNGVTRPVYTVVITGERTYGAKEHRCSEAGKDGLSRAREELPGRDLILTGHAGEAGTRILIWERLPELKKRFSPEWLAGLAESNEKLSCAPETAVFRRIGAILHDVSEGGLYSALYELAEGYRCGFRVDLRAVPIRQETVEICEFLEGDPFALLSTGCMLAAVADGQETVRELAESGIDAAVIGKLTGGRDKVLIKGEEEGFLGRPGQDMIMRLENFG